MSNTKSKYPVLQLDLRLISDLVVVIVSATCGGIAFACAGEPVITGYQLAGSIIGPGSLSFVSEMVQVFSQDKSIYEAVENAFITIYLWKNPTETAKNLLNLATDSNIGDRAALEFIVAALVSKGDISSSMSRLYLGLGRDGLLPSIFAKVQPTRHTPIHSQVWVGIIAIVLAGLFNVQVLFPHPLSWLTDRLFCCGSMCDNPPLYR